MVIFVDLSLIFDIQQCRGRVDRMEKRGLDLGPDTW